MVGPFDGIEMEEWSTKRDELIEDHPLDLEDVQDLVLDSYDELLQTRIGDPDDDIKIFEDAKVGAQATGAFLETILANKLQDEYPVWRQGSESEKDLIHTDDSRYSIEMKLSGQVDDKIYGNRSYAKGSEDKKSKSGYYLCINVHISEDVTSPSYLPFLIRFGWISFSDWSGQESESGQASKISSEVYKYKLKTVIGEYMLNTPLEHVYMIGPSTMGDIDGFVQEHNITTVGEFIRAYENTANPGSSVQKVYNRVEGFPSNTITMEQDNIDFTDSTDQTTLTSGRQGSSGH